MNVNKNKYIIGTLLNMYHLQGRKCFIEPSIKEWLKQWDIPLQNDTEPAVTFISKETLLRDVIFREIIDERDLRSVSFAISHRDKVSYSLVLSKIGDMKRFFMHTVLHEIAHMLGTEDHAEADQWAFEELEKLDMKFFEQIDIS